MTKVWFYFDTIIEGMKLFTHTLIILYTWIFFLIGLVRFASNAYSADNASLSDVYTHLTNYSINKFSSTYQVIQIVNYRNACSISYEVSYFTYLMANCCERRIHQAETLYMELFFRQMKIQIVDKGINGR